MVMHTFWEHSTQASIDSFQGLKFWHSSVFAYCKRSNTGAGEGLGTRLGQHVKDLSLHFKAIYIVPGCLVFNWISVFTPFHYLFPALVLYGAELPTCCFIHSRIAVWQPSINKPQTYDTVWLVGWLEFSVPHNEDVPDDQSSLAILFTIQFMC